MRLTGRWRRRNNGLQRHRLLSQNIYNTQPGNQTIVSKALSGASVAADDLALFQAATNAASNTYFQRLTGDCPEKLLPGGRSFPLAEPTYDAKRRLDLTPFDGALATFPRRRADELDALLTGADIPDLQALMANGSLNAVELVIYYVDRIRRYDVDKLNSVLELNPYALAVATSLDAERAVGAVRSPLHGIPVLLKANIATGDRMHTTAGAYALREWRADRDAFLAQKLRDAGAVILGKTNLSEWANYMDPCMPNGFSVLGGQTRNPYGPFDTLGSSSGSAVAVAAHFATVSVGSETSGSLIQPARYNSLVTLRPSLGLISRDHIIPLAPDLDTPGPMGRSVIDVAILLNAMAGADQNDDKTEYAARLAGVDFTHFLSTEEAKKLRVGVLIPNRAASASLSRKITALAEAIEKELSPEEQQRLMREEVLPELGGDPQVALDTLKLAGIEAIAIDDATLPPAADTALPLLPYGFRTGIADFFRRAAAPIQSLDDVIAVNAADPANRSPYGQGLVAAAAVNTTTAEEYVRIRSVAQTLARAWMRTVLESHAVDILVTGMAYTSNAGAAGIPALTIPAGLDARGRPQGIILSGDYLSEPLLFAVGYALEQALQGRVHPDLEATMRQIETVLAR